MNFLTKASDYSVLWLASRCTELLFAAYRVLHSEAFRITILVSQDITASKSLVIRKSGEEEKRKRISEIFEFEWWNNEHAITPLQPRKKKKKPEGKVWTAFVKSGESSACFWAVQILRHRLSVPALARLPIFRAEKKKMKAYPWP